MPGTRLYRSLRLQRSDIVVALYELGEALQGHEADNDIKRFHCTLNNKKAAVNPGPNAVTR